MSLAGVTNLTATAWFYTPDPTPVKIEVRRQGLVILAAKESKGSGWTSLTVPISVQSDLDGLTMHFKKGFGSGNPRIYASFLQLTYTAPIPKVYWGSWIDGDVYTGPSEESWPDAPYTQTKPTWDTFESHTGKSVSIVHFGQPAPWNQKFAPSPLENTSARGAIPMLDMDPDGITLSEILAQKRDADFRKWFSDAASYAKPFFFRWSWEMNGNWFKPYGEESATSPELYVKVWRHLHDLAEEEGAKNVTWVWCPNVSFTGSTPLSQLYPGDAYVDWTCMDGYNRGDNTIKPEGWRTFSEVFSKTYSEILGIAPSKPVMIGEVASTEAHSFPVELKWEWIAKGLGNSLYAEFPKVRALVWFNWNIEEPEGSGNRWDWQIESTPASQASFGNVISSPYFAGNTFGNLPNLTKVQPLP